MRKNVQSGLGKRSGGIKDAKRIFCVCDFKNIWKKYYFKTYVKQFIKGHLDRRKFIRGNLRMENA